MVMVYSRSVRITSYALIALSIVMHAAVSILCRSVIDRLTDTRHIGHYHSVAQ